MQVSRAVRVMCVVGIFLAWPVILGAAYQVNESSEIGRKWVKLGGEAEVGAPTSIETDLSGTVLGEGSYQTFERGVIVYSEDYGAVLISMKIFQRWMAAESQTTLRGENLLAYLGFPVDDYQASPTIEKAYFGMGAIIARIPESAAYVVCGEIEVCYVETPDIGEPTSEEVSDDLNGTVQAFDGGDIWLPPDSPLAFAVQGEIRDRWIVLGGPGGTLGYPTADEAPVLAEDGVEIGRSMRFENGAIYASPATLPVEVMADFLNARTGYEKYGGPAGWLGFPLSSQVMTAGSNIYQDFQGGVLVWYSPDEKIHAFQDVELFIQRLEGQRHDLINVFGGVDCYFKIFLTLNGVTTEYRRPEHGDYGGGHDLEETFDLTPGGQPVYGAMSIVLEIKGYDAQWGPDDALGKFTLEANVDNLWLTTAETNTYEAHHDPGERILATLAFKSHVEFEMTNFRQQMWWSFDNVGTPTLTKDQYAATFRDVGLGEWWWLHPFNALYYECVYKRAARPGNCFGMCLESINAQVGRSLFAEPINDYYCSWNADDPVKREINIKQGYTVGAGVIRHTARLFFSGATHAPRFNFVWSKHEFESGNYPIMIVTPSYFTQSVHAVRPYSYDVDSDPSKWTMYVADPNWPYIASPYYSSHYDNNCRIDVIGDTFHFVMPTGDEWSGGEWSGGRMWVVPYSVVDHTPRTPFWEVITLGTIIFIGDAGQTNQIEDVAGNTFYEPGLAEPPTRWDEIRSDDHGIPELARIPMPGADGEAPIEMYYQASPDISYVFEVSLKNGHAAGTPIEWGMRSPTVSSTFNIPGDPAASDFISIDTQTRALSFKVPNTGAEKKIEWRLSGPGSDSWIELTEVRLVPGQSIAARLENRGRKVKFENDGPATTAFLTVKSGKNNAPVFVGNIPIGQGTVPDFDFSAPKTDATVEGTWGENGWYVTPVIITLSAFDYSSTGIEFIEYSRDQVTWNRYTGPFLYEDEGGTVLHYRAKDNDGNIESAKSITLHIDTRPPVVTAWTDKVSYTRVEPFVVHYAATDPAPGSGLASTVATFASQPVENEDSVDMLWYPLGEYTLEVASEDVAGLVTTKKATVQLEATLDGLRATIQRLTQMGLIKDPGITDALTAIVDNAIMAKQRRTVKQLMIACENLVIALGEKGLTLEAANLLLMDIRFLITSNS